LFLDNEPNKNEDKIDVEKFRKKIKKNSWSQVLSNIHMNFDEEYNNIKFDTNGIDINEEGSAMEVMHRAKMGRAHCDTFSKYMRALLFCSNITTLKSVAWYSKDFTKPGLLV